MLNISLLNGQLIETPDRRKKVVYASENSVAFVTTYEEIFDSRTLHQHIWFYHPFLEPFDKRSFMVSFWVKSLRKDLTKDRLTLFKTGCWEIIYKFNIAEVWLTVELLDDLGGLFVALLTYSRIFFHLTILMHKSQILVT